MLPKVPYRERVEAAQRPEEVMETVHDHIWDAVNAHLGTTPARFPNWLNSLASCASAIVHGRRHVLRLRSDSL